MWIWGYEKMKNKILLLVFALFLSIFWANSIISVATNNVLIDGITMSVILVTMLTMVFSFVSWSLLSWANHKKPIMVNSITSVILGFIVISPIAQISGPMLGIILGVITGSFLFGFEFRRERKSKYVPMEEDR